MNLKTSFVLASFILSSMVCIHSCEEADEDDLNPHIGLPTAFPLETGNAWIYERHYYEDDVDSVVLDTLYISGQYEDYFKYTWRPDEYASLVKNLDGLLLSCGRIDYTGDGDTLMYEIPSIWAFFAEDTGFVDFTKHSEYRIYDEKIHIGIESNIEAFGNFYSGYVASRIDTSINEILRDQVTTRAGFYQWRHYDQETQVKYRESIMIQQLRNFLPKPSVQKRFTKKGSTTLPLTSDGF